MKARPSSLIRARIRAFAASAACGEGRRGRGGGAEAGGRKDGGAFFFIPPREDPRVRRVGGFRGEFLGRPAEGDDRERRRRGDRDAGLALEHAAERSREDEG